ncbi:sugar transferase [bacterium]|nr:sugar transferase [bacterium]
MGIIPWESLPLIMKNDEVYPYYQLLKNKPYSLLGKRVFDVGLGLALVIILLPLYCLISLAIVLDSQGPVFYRQERVTQYGRKFRIFKFRTMVRHAESIGSQLTTQYDTRITRVGRFLRRFRLDEIPQLFNIFSGDMTFVGTRPEVEKYVSKYTPEMYATLLLPAGVTSEASIQYKDEERLLSPGCNVDQVYIQQILPEKMKYNLASLQQFSLVHELRTMVRTVLAVLHGDRTA